jgi:DNA-directed RNA polymerase subunit RPC12/RpoP
MAEQDIRRTRTCEKCKKTISLDDVRYYPKGHDVYMLVCEKCKEDLKNISKGDINKLKANPEYAFGKPKIPKILASVPRPEQQKAETTTKVSGDPSKVMYNCSRCKYDFKVDEYGLRSPKVQCPYCGKSDKTKKK